MLRKEIFFSRIEQIQKFNARVIHCSYEADLQQGKYLVDAKSIMGIFSLDIHRPILLVLYTDQTEELEKFKEYWIENTKGEREEK